MTAASKRKGIGWGIKDAMQRVRPPAELEPKVEAMARRHRTSKTVKLRPVHLTSRIPLLSRQRPALISLDHLGSGEPGVGSPAAIAMHGGRPIVRGWQDAQQRLEKLGLWVRLSPRGRAFLVSDRGRAPDGAVSTFAAVSSWIGAGLRDEPWPCDWCPSEAIALLAGDPPVPVCEEHGG